MPRVVLALVLLAVAGCGGDDDAAGPRPAPAPKAVHGLYRAAGARLFMDCHGAGPRTVVLDSGLGVDSNATWARVRPAVARFTRVCQYDRAGMGSSPPGPRPRTSQRMVDELRALLRAAGVKPPYVLVGASFGGLNAQLFASEHPGEVAGVVLVDGLHPDLVWGALQRANAVRSPLGRVILAPRSHHRLAEDQPDLVVAAIGRVVSG
jgi:pimeloyl-ACP methyl ester carboxylesterase